MDRRTWLIAALFPLFALGAAALAAPAGKKPSQDVLVFGGSGGLGSEIVRDLVADGHRLSVFVRPTSNRSRLAGLPVSYIEGDVLVEADVRRALQSQRFGTSGRSADDHRGTVPRRSRYGNVDL